MARGRPSKKGLIAETALTLFQVLGYQATSIDQVVLEAGVSKPTVYSNYPSKLSLWQEVLRQIIERSEFA
ncbi:TetR/AcrR family transcriptional regulator, partial [Grimontia celer]